MNRLFQLIPFHGRSFLWNYHTISLNDDFKGFYHLHQGCELLFVHEGQGKVFVNQQTYELRKGMLFFFHPFQLHNVFVDAGVSKPYERSVFHFDATILEEGLAFFPNLHQLFIRMRQGMITDFAFDLSKEYDFFNHLYKSFHAVQTSSLSMTDEEGSLFLLQLLSNLRWKIKSNHSNEQQARSLRYSEMIMQWIEKHYHEPFKLDRLAESLHLSKPYISRVFRRETGSNINEYLVARRIKEACKLLQTSNLSMGVIAEQVGIPNVPYFISVFKKMIGATPYQFKMKHISMITSNQQNGK